MLLKSFAQKGVPDAHRFRRGDFYEEGYGRIRRLVVQGKSDGGGNHFARERSRIRGAERERTAGGP